MSITTSEGPAGSAFMDDFYAECDEHFGEVRGALLHLEASINRSAPDSTTLLRLFRSFHSLKGIFGMASLHVAETLAHRTEDYLRSLTRHQKPLGEAGYNALASVTERLEQIVLAHRQGESPPDISGLAAELGKLAESPAASDNSGTNPSPRTLELEEKVREAQARGLTIWHCLFEPSPALSQKGRNVNSARARVQALGEILYSAPKVQGAGKIHFEFIVAGPADPGDATQWQEEGITLLPYSVPSGAPPIERVPEPAAAPAFVTPSHIVRVDLTRLDELMRIMGDMVVHRARLEEISSRVMAYLPTSEARSLQEVNAAFGRELRNLRDGLMRVRLVSIGEIFQRLPFVVRDLARENGKKIRLAVTGQETEVDKYLVERLKDPLLHLVRNAVCHGIEAPEERVARGKPPEATITLRASVVGESVLIEVKDDGRGIDEAKIRENARAAGVVLADHLEAAQLLDLICRPGFSTRNEAEADRGAGRGVGMTAVRNTVAEMGGQLTLESDAERGTTFYLRLPLTLAIADALILAAGGERFALPQGMVQEITVAETSTIKELEQNEVMPYRTGVLPIIRLSSVFGLPAESRAEFPVLVIGTGLGAVGIATDRLLGQREIVVRPVNDPLLKVPAIAGATELGDGRAVLILDPTGLVETARDQKRVRTGGAAGSEAKRRDYG